MDYGDKSVVGLFEMRQNAEAVLQELETAGFAREHTSLAFRDRAAALDMAETTGTAAVEAAGGGAIGGGILGGLAGLLVGIGALTVPGVGPVLAAGPLAAALGTTLAGAGIGA